MREIVRVSKYLFDCLNCLNSIREHLVTLIQTVRFLTEIIQAQTREQQAEQYLNLEEVADLLGRSKRTIRDWKQKGKLKTVHIDGVTLFPESQIRALKERR